MRRHVYFYTLLDHAYRDLARALGAAPGTWLPEPAEPVADGWHVELRAGRALAGPMASRLALVHIGPAAAVGPVASVGPEGPPADGMLRTVRWQATRADRLFPVLSADLELAPLSGSGAQLSIMGSYRPPLSVVGDAADRVLGHRVAEACVRQFVLDVAAKVSAATLPA